MQVFFPINETQRKRYLHIDGRHFIFVSDSGMQNLAVIELFRYASNPDPSVQMMQPHMRETLVYQRHVRIENSEQTSATEWEERNRLRYLIKKAVWTAVQEYTAAFFHADPNVRSFAMALQEVHTKAKEDNENMKYILGTVAKF